MSQMRAKMQVSSVHDNGDGAEITSQVLKFSAVAASEYGEDGSDENNTYAKFTPDGAVRLVVANPDLIGKFAVGDEYYVDFTKAGEAEQEDPEEEEPEEEEQEEEEQEEDDGPEAEIDADGEGGGEGVPEVEGTGGVDTQGPDAQ